MSAGMFERAEGLRLRIIQQLKEAGVKRFLTVCPGCGEEFAMNMPEDIEIIPLPEFLYDQTQDAPDAAAAGFHPTGSQGDGEIVSSTDAAPKSPASFAVFDSCHDRRDNRHGLAIRRLMAKYLPEAERREIPNHRKATLCCGAGGAVAGYDDDITARRTAEVIDEGRSTGADVLVTMCPTCAYTIGQANLGQPALGRTAADGVASQHYLELLFGITTDWAAIFANLESMWCGEYGPWLTETFFS